MLDREERAEYQLTVVCSDHGTTPSSLSSHAVIHIRVTDTNDVTPTFDQQLYQTTIVENNHVGAAILQVPLLPPPPSLYVSFCLHLSLAVVHHVYPCVLHTVSP